MDNRTLNHPDGKIPFRQKDYDFCSVVYYTLMGTATIFMKDETGAFASMYEPGDYDWYILVAIEKLDKITTDRHLIDRTLIMQYRGAIREAYQKEYGRTLKRKYDHPSNKNTISAVRSYIERINNKAYDNATG